MGDDHQAGIVLAVAAQFVGGEALVHLAVALPGDDLHVGLGGDVFGEIFVGQENHALGAQALHHLDGVRGGATDVAFRLNLGRRVHVGDDRHAGKARAQQPHVGGGDRLGERAARLHVGDQHHLVGIEDFRGLRHEVHAALNDDVRVRLGRLAGELERIPDHVGDAIVDFRRLIIVRQDDRVALALERVDRLHVGREEWPFDRRHHRLDALVEVRGFARDRLVPFERGHGQDAEPARGRGAIRGRNWRRAAPGGGPQGFHDGHVRLLLYAQLEHILLPKEPA